MQSRHPLQGNENLGDLTRPEEPLVRFYEAVNGGDLALLEHTGSVATAAKTLDVLKEAQVE